MGEAKIKKRVRQECTLLPNHILKAYTQKAKNIIKNETNLGVNINGRKIDMLRFADNGEDLAKIIKTMDEIFTRELNVRINIYINENTSAYAEGKKMPE